MSIQFLIIAGTVTCLSLAIHFALAWMAGRGHVAIRIALRVAAVLFTSLSVFCGLAVIFFGSRSYNRYYDQLFVLYEILLSPTEDTISFGILIDSILFTISFVLAIPIGRIIERLFRHILPPRDTIPNVASTFE